MKLMGEGLTYFCNLCGKKFKAEELNSIRDGYSGNILVCCRSCQRT